MAYNYPYGMPYQAYMPQQNQQPNSNFNNMYQQPQQPQLNQFAFVNGLEGAKAYQIMPNQTMMLMDSDNPVVYMKKSNSMGQSTLEYYKLTKITEQDIKQTSQDNSNIQYALKADLDALTKRLDDLSSLLESLPKNENKGE